MGSREIEKLLNRSVEKWHEVAKPFEKIDRGKEMTAKRCGMYED